MKAKTTTTPVLDVEQLEKAADRLRSVAHPMRVTIIELLMENGKLCVTEIYKKCKIEQAGASSHLRILKEAGVLTSRRDGKKIYYSVNTKSLKHIIDTVDRCLVK